MAGRLFSVFVVVFWLLTMGWLVAVVWAPPESRMARVDPREVYSVFFAWNESTNMTLLDNGLRRGQITISGGSGEVSDTGKFTNSLSLSGMLDSNDGQEVSRRIDLFWKGVLEFSESLEMDLAEFSIRVPSRQSTAHLALERKEKPASDPGTESDDEGDGERSSTGTIDLAKGDFPFIFRARALINRQEIFSFDSSVTGSSALPLQMLPFGSVMGIDSFQPDQLKFDVEARRGTFTFGGRDLRAYLLIFRAVEQEGALRVYLSEAGEPLRIETDLGFEAVSEILVPLDAYRKNSDKS